MEEARDGDGDEWEERGAGDSGCGHGLDVDVVWAQAGELNTLPLNAKIKFTRYK